MDKYIKFNGSMDVALENTPTINTGEIKKGS